MESSVPHDRCGCDGWGAVCHMTGEAVMGGGEQCGAR